MLWNLPAVLIGIMIWQYAVDVPFYDDFATGDTLYKSVTTGLHWTDLVSQHNESRPLFPRPLFNRLGTLSRWDLRWQMAASLTVVECTALLLLALIRRSIADPRSAFLIALLANILLLSPVQWQNFLWGIQFIVFIPMFSLGVILLALGSPWSIWLTLPVAILAAVVATYSSSNGLLVWFVPIPCFVFHPSLSRLTAMAVWLFIAAVVLGSYFHDYQNPGDPALISVLRQPLAAGEFMLAFIGNGIRLSTRVDQSARYGLAVVAIWFAGVVYLAAIIRSPVLRQNAIPWITLGLYSLASAALAMAGRLVTFGLPGAVSERYPTFAIPIWISLVPLWTVTFLHVIPKNSRRKRLAIGVTWALSAAILALTFDGYLFVREEMRAFNAHWLAGRAVAQFALVVRDDAAISATLLPDVSTARRALIEMGRIDYLPLYCFGSNDISTIAANASPGSAGHFDQIRVDANGLEFSGSARIPTTGNLADAILLTTPDERGTDRIFAIAWQTRLERPDVQRQTRRPLLGQSGWRRRFDRTPFPPGTVITAWAFDTHARRAYRIDGTQRI